MINALLASGALLVGTAIAQGSAIVINSCSYDVQLDNVPAADGGFNAISKTLSPGGSYSQVYTELTNGDGWSIKLSKSNDWSNIMQYEYTFHNDGIIWFDLSDVNGNPWNGDWMITASGDCTPKQTAYQYATDDAYGMQACIDTSSVTVTLCSGDSGSGSGGSSPAPSSPAESAAPATTYAPPPPPASTVTPAPVASTPAAAPPQQGPPAQNWSVGNNKVEEAASTLATSSTPTPPSGGVTVTNIKMEIVTEYVTATAVPTKRHAHVARHAHHYHM